MTASLMIVWDYDSALGQINSSLPYNFSYNQIYEEIKNVDFILEKAKALNIKMTFACLGFDAEEGVFPFNNPGQIRKIFEEGHEIASHSWRHEWFPFLTDEQIKKSLERSKYVLEKCLNVKDSVKGFVPPHSRPMSWYKKFSFSIGDRAIYPFHKGSDTGYILKQLSHLNYKWCRVLKSYKPLWKKMFNNSKDDELIFKKWEVHNGIVCVPQHYTGFDEHGRKFLKRAIECDEALVVVGHPSALSRSGAESVDNFNRFTDDLENYVSSGKLETMRVFDYVEKNIIDKANVS